MRVYHDNEETWEPRLDDKDYAVQRINGWDDFVQIKIKL